jgi:hypothetical protein
VWQWAEQVWACRLYVQGSLASCYACNVSVCANVPVPMPRLHLRTDCCITAAGLHQRRSSRPSVITAGVRQVGREACGLHVLGFDQPRCGIHRKAGLGEAEKWHADTHFMHAHTIGPCRNNYGTACRSRWLSLIRYGLVEESDLASTASGRRPAVGCNNGSHYIGC